jgi:hypothetical protein
MRGPQHPVSHSLEQQLVRLSYAGRIEFHRPELKICQHMLTDEAAEYRLVLAFLLMEWWCRRICDESWFFALPLDNDLYRLHPNRHQHLQES